MGKIYEGENKLNIIQVCGKLAATVDDDHRKVIATRLVLNGYGKEKIKNYKKFFAHTILDCYKDIRGEDQEKTMEVKKYCKHLLEKYMKSSTVVDGEESAFMIMMNDMIEKAEID